MLLKRKGEALDALQQIVNTGFRRELDDDRSFVVDCMGYRRGKDDELKQMTRFTMEKAKLVRAAGDGAAQSVLAPPRPPDRRRGSRDVVGEHRRRVSEDRYHFEEVGFGFKGFTVQGGSRSKGSRFRAPEPLEPVEP